MTVLEALATLESATLECKQRDIDTPEVREALTLLEPHIQPEWLISQFRYHVQRYGQQHWWELEAQQQVLCAIFPRHSRIGQRACSVSKWTPWRGTSPRLTT